MLTIEYFSHLPAFSMSGHAKEAPRGADIVCAGASALLFTLIAMLDGKEDDLCPEFFEHNDHYNITCQPELRYMPDALGIFRDFAKGFEFLARYYPDYVKFIKDPPLSAKKEPIEHE